MKRLISSLLDKLILGVVLLAALLAVIVAAWAVVMVCAKIGSFFGRYSRVVCILSEFVVVSLIFHIYRKVVEDGSNDHE